MSAMLGPQIDFCPPYAAWRFFSFFDTANPEENNLCSKSATRRPSSRRPLSNRGCCSNPVMGIRHRTERNRTPVARIRSAEIEAHKNRDGNVEVDVTAGCRVGRTGARMGKHSASAPRTRISPAPVTKEVSTPTVPEIFSVLSLQLFAHRCT